MDTGRGYSELLRHSGSCETQADSEPEGARWSGKEIDRQMAESRSDGSRGVELPGTGNSPGWGDIPNPKQYLPARSAGQMVCPRSESTPQRAGFPSEICR